MSDVCDVLNGYTPGGFEQVIKGSRDRYRSVSFPEN